MATFLDDLSDYNAKAALVIKNLALDGNFERANLFSSLKSTANDTSLSVEVRLNALTALINGAGLLEIALPPYFPLTTTYASIQSYTGIHNDLEGLNVGDYLHLTAAQVSSFTNKASLSDITFANILGAVGDNASLAAALATKQPLLASGTGYLKSNGTTFSYDNSTFLTSTTGIASGGSAGGDLSGTYPNPSITNNAVITKVLTGYSSGAGVVSASDTILQAIQKLNGNIASVASSAGTITGVSLTLPTSLFANNTGVTSGAAALASTFRGDITQKTFFAAPASANGTPSFRTIVATDLPATTVTPATYGSSIKIPTFTVDAYGRITSASELAFSSGGTVINVGLTAADLFTVSGSPVSVSGNLAFQWDTVAPNLVLAGASSGTASEAPTFRALAALDIPDIAISQVTNLTNVLSGYISTRLTGNSIFIGNGSNILADSVVFGDLSAYYDTDQAGGNIAVFTIVNEAVTYAKFQDIPTKVLLGRAAATNGVMQQVTLSADFVFDDGGEISLASPVAPILTNKGDLLTSLGSSSQVVLPIGADATILMADNAIATGNKWVALTGVLYIPTTGVVELVDGSVGIGKLEDIANNTILGNISGGDNSPTALSVSETTEMLNIFTSDYSAVPTAGLKGLVPGANIVPVVGKTLTDFFLNASGTWTVPAGGGGGGSGTVTSVSVVSANGFAGTVATPTVAAAITISTTITGLLKGNGTAISAATSGTDYAPATSGSSILYGDGTGGFSSVTIGTNLSFTGGTLNASSTMMYPGAGIANSTGTAWGTSYTTSGTGTVLALATSPTLVTPVLGVATATSINKVAITAPASSATLTIADGKTLTVSNTLAFTGTDTSSVAFGTGGTVAYVGAINSWAAGIKQTFNPSSTNAGINVGSVTGTPSVAVVGDLIYNTAAGQLQGYVGSTWVSLGGGTINTGVQYAVPYYTTAGTTLDDIAPPTTNGTYVLTSVVSASTAVLPTWVAPSIPFNALIAAAATNTINNVSYAQEWQWNSLAGATGLKLSSTSTAAASNTQTLFAVALSGANATTTQTTTAASIANTHTGTSSTNIGLSLAASGGTTINYALDVTNGISRFAEGTASFPQLILKPSSAVVPSGTVDGSIWYDTTANNSTIQLRKLYTTGTSVLTKVITASYNPDFATGTASGVVVADLNGTLTKSADLTALGIFAQSSTVTVASTIAATTLLGTLTGSATLPVNFFAVGKTIIVYVTGTYSGTASSPTCTLNLTIGGIAMGSIVLTHNNALTTVFYDAQFIVTCRTTGASGTLQYSAIGKLNSGTATSSSVFFQNSTTSGSVDTTGTLLVGLTATWSASSGSNSLTASIVTATYLN